MYIHSEQETNQNTFIRREEAWRINNVVSFPKGTLVLSDKKLTFHAFRNTTNQDVEILLVDVEKVKVTYKAILYQNIGVYLKHTHYIFQVKNGSEWVDEINNAVSIQKAIRNG